MPILSYLLNDFSSDEGYWGSDNVHPYTFQAIIKDIYERHQPKSILEIGFNIGCSATMWLEWDESEQVFLQAIDIGKHKHTEAAAAKVKDKYGEHRFDFLKSCSTQAWGLLDREFDMGFIDGDHNTQVVENDINLCIDRGAKILVFDDYHAKDDRTQSSNGVKYKVDDFVAEGILIEDKIYEIPEPRIPSQIGVFKVIR